MRRKGMICDLPMDVCMRNPWKKAEWETGTNSCTRFPRASCFEKTRHVCQKNGGACRTWYLEYQRYKKKMQNWIPMCQEKHKETSKQRFRENNRKRKQQLRLEKLVRKLCLLPLIQIKLQILLLLLSNRMLPSCQSEFSDIRMSYHQQVFSDTCLPDHKQRFSNIRSLNCQQ